MNSRLRPSLGSYIIGVLLASGGLVLIVSPLLLTIWLGVVPICLLLGGAMLLAGVGLCRARPWARELALAIAITGLAVVFWRLLENGAAEWPWLLGALITDAVIAIVLLRARPEASTARDEGYE